MDDIVDDNRDDNSPRNYVRPHRRTAANVLLVVYGEEAMRINSNHRGL